MVQGGIQELGRQNAPSRESIMKNLEVFKEQLLALRSRLRGDVGHMADSALGKDGPEASGGLSRMPIHMADLGSDNFEQEFTLSLMQTEEETLDQIDAALKRIEDGAYGQCQQCGVRIPTARLSAIPYTPLCVKCAEQDKGDK